MLFILAAMWGCARVNDLSGTLVPAKLAQKPRNIVLMIGDGMGLSQISAALYDANQPLNLERFPVVGFQKTHSHSDLITDSAAGATAMGCGIKTYNNAIGVGPDTVPCKTILEEARDRGLSTALVATSTIVHATPAAFIAHQPLRSFYEFIAAEMADSGIDLLVGGGVKYFMDRKVDDRNLVRELKQKDYHITNSIPSISDSTRFDKLACFTAEESPSTVSEGRDYLEKASAFSMYFLRSRPTEGFFIMIEGSQIDWGGHWNREQMLVEEMQDFDDAIGAVLDFAFRDGQTLVIVTADHECGGLGLNEGKRPNKLEPEFTTTGHTGTMVPVFAYGPRAELFSGIYENTAIYHKMKQALGWEDAVSDRPPGP